MAVELKERSLLTVPILLVDYTYKYSAPVKKEKKPKLVALKVKKPKADSGPKNYEFADKFVLRIADTVDPEPEYVLRLFKKIGRRREKGLPELKNKKFVAQIVRLNQRFVARLARRYIGHGLQFEDLFQEGNIGLMRAIDKFDWKKGYKFSTYAEWWVKEGITRAIKNKSRLIRIPIQRQQLKVKAQKAYHDLYTNHHIAANSKQLACKTGLTVAQVEEFVTYNYDPASLDGPVCNGRDTPLADLLSDSSPLPEENIEREQDNIVLYSALKVLPSHDAKFVKRFYGLSGSPPRTVEQMSELYAMSKSAINKRLNEVHLKLREIIDGQSLNVLI